jgi:hypothetical protein
VPRFFFDINDHDLSHQDEEGSEWPSRDAARAHAMRILADIARDEARRQDRLHLFVTIRDQHLARLTAPMAPGDAGRADAGSRPRRKGPSRRVTEGMS